MLPLVLAGPILRRVEPTLVAVWIALDREATVAIELWEGRVKTGTASPHARSDPATKSLRIGARLHVVMALLKIPAASDKKLKAGINYSYDVEITETDGTKHTLATLGLLKSTPTSNGGPASLARPHLALGYEDDFLPGFALPPETLEDLRILYGSCRRPTNEHGDAMAWIDDVVAEEKLYEQPLKRPHQLVLGGDQIYADDVWSMHLLFTNLVANELIGVTDDPDGKHGLYPPPIVTSPLSDEPAERPESKPIGKPIEHLIVDHTEKRLTETPPGEDHEDPTGHPSGYAPSGRANVPAGLAEFPAGRRRPLVLRDAQMTTTDAASHLLSFGEFAAMYVMVWSNACWPLEADWPTADKLLSGMMDSPPLRPEVGPYLAARTDWASLPELEKQQRRDGHTVTQQQLKDFVAGLTKVRRTLANVPTYMIFDDHDVTDDWNLNPIWCDRVYTTSLGREILRNGLASYAIFQDWGNDPLRYENERDDPGPKGEPNRLLKKIAQMFPPGATEGPSQEVGDALDVMLGLNLRPQPTIDGDYEAVSPPIKWHFSVGGPKHLMVALDNRTRRSFVSRNGPPGNVAIPAQAEQIPETLPAGCEVLIVVAPLQVLGAALLDELIAPVAFRIFDAKGHAKLNELDKEAIAAAAADAEAGHPDRIGIGSRRMSGTDPDAIEAWAFDTDAFEALLKRLAGHKRVVLLSGDVHYTAANAMTYWTKGSDEAARIVQFTCSGFKNVMPWYIGTVDRVLSFAQRMVRTDIGAERLGWDAKTEGAFTFTAGHSLADVSPALRKKLNEAPMLMPTFGWPEGTTVTAAKLPDWSWRMAPVLDARPDEQRPKPGRPRSLEPDAASVETALAPLADPSNAIKAYHTVAARHQDQFDRMRHSRQILFRANFAQVRFDRGAGGAADLVAVHEVFSVLRDPDEALDAKVLPEAYMVQRAPLNVPADEIRPELAPFKPPAF